MARAPSAGGSDLGVLSRRETTIATLVSWGLSNKEIAQYLKISPWTVSTHLKRMFLKLGICRRVELCIIVSSAGRGVAGHGEPSGCSR